MKKKLRIAQVAPIIERVPPDKYGGIERMVHDLTEELIGFGHEVTLFASGDSKTGAKLISVYPRGLRESKINPNKGAEEWTFLNLNSAYKIQESFDIIHDHNTIMGLPFAQYSKVPVVVTLHGAIDLNNRRLFSSFTNPYYVSISKSQVESSPSIKTAANIYNGLNLESYPFSRNHKGYLLFVGRMSFDKGVHHAIDVAQDLNIPLIIAAKLDDQYIPYYKQYIEPRLYNGQIKWIGEVSEKERNKLMSEAICLLNPVTWKEPFGLVMIEAMACGCPVLAFNRGSVPEIVEDKKTGYIVKDIEEMAFAVSEINRIDRMYCREYVLKKFNSRKMALAYEKLFYDILEIKL